MIELKLRVLNDDENPIKYMYNVSFKNVDYANLKSIAEKLQTHLEDKIYPITISFTGKGTFYDSFELYFTRKQAKRTLDIIVPCPKEGMELKFRGVER